MSYTKKLRWIGEQIDELLAEAKGSAAGKVADVATTNASPVVNVTASTEVSVESPQRRSAGELNFITPEQTNFNNLSSVFIATHKLRAARYCPRCVLSAHQKSKRVYANIRTDRIKGSFFHSARLEDILLIFDRVHIGPTDVYGILATNDRCLTSTEVPKYMGTIHVSDSTFSDSLLAVPLIFGEGFIVKLNNVEALQNTNARDRNHQAVGFHAANVSAKNCVFGWSLIGPREDNFNPRKHTTVRAEFIDTDFVDGFSITRGVQEFRLIGENKRCQVNLDRHTAHKDLSGHGADYITKVFLKNVDFKGKNRPYFAGCGVTHENCTYNGVPCLKR